jgi:hypothetical protein
MSAQSPIARPWYLSLALGASAWLAGILMLMGFALLLDFNSPGEFTSVGIVLIGAAFVLMLIAKDRDFATQLGLCLSVAGQCLVIAGLADGFDSPGHIASMCLLMQIVLATAMPNRLHRSFSAFFAVIAWAFWIRIMPFGGNFDDMFWDSRANAAFALPTGQAMLWWALTWVPVSILCWVLVRQTAHKLWNDGFLPILRGLLIGLACASVLSNFGAIFGTFGQGSVAVWCLLSAAAAFAALMMSFMMQNKPLMGFCIACVFAHLVHFYYALGTTLVEKSVLMLVIGVVCLSAQQLLKANSKSRGIL